MNDTVEELKTGQGELTRADIAIILSSIGKPGVKRDAKTEAVREVCTARGTGRGHGGHPIWEALEDFGEF